MLATNQGIHEADVRDEDAWDTEARLSPDEEAHRVAAAIGLPAAFDPTIKPYPGPPPSAQRALGPSLSTPALISTLGSTSERRDSTPPPAASANNSGDEDSGEDDDEEDFDIVSGQQALKARREREQQAELAQKERLHAMEVGEAAALLKSGAKIAEEDDEDEGDSTDVVKTDSASTTGGT